MVSRILLVDGQSDNLDELEGWLRSSQHAIGRATHARAASSLFAAQEPDLMLLAAHLPDGDGIDVLSEIRSREGTSRVPVILIVDEAGETHDLRAAKAGADAILRRPLDRDVLLARVRTLLDVKRSSDAYHASHAELLRRHRAMLDAEREHRELTSFIVHDLKTPLSAVRLGLEWARGQLLPGQTELADAIGDAYDAAGRLGSMIGDLLTVSTMERADFRVHRQPVSVRSLFDLVTHSYARRADAKGIALATWPPDNLVVQADPTLLQRVLENIVENAFRYTKPKGHIALSARPWHGVEIAISNDGPPIPKIERARIFEKFTRGDADGPEAGSAGLGLYFCKRAVEAHGGAINIVETKEWPTSFRINLP